MDFGKAAGVKTAALLAKPFTVHTYFRDALGDGQNRRVYGFVTTADGNDLAEELVKSGLARAFGVYADGPGGRSPEDYKALLADLELQAAKRGLGIWKETIWEKLPIERLEQRKDDNEINAAVGKQPLPPGFKLDPNKAAMDDLLKLPKIAEELANRITEGRPYKNLDDLDRVDGIGPKTLELLKPYLEFPESKQ
jgi:competence protein ComEA